MEKDKINQEKYAQDLERYETIVNYFSGNPSRVFENILYLDRIYDSLIKSFPEKINISDEDIQEKIGIICMDRESNGIYSKSKELGDKISSMHVNNLLKKLRKIEAERLEEGSSI